MLTGVSFSRSIDLGQIIIICSVLAGLIGGWYTLRQRVTHIEGRIAEMMDFFRESERERRDDMTTHRRAIDEQQAVVFKLAGEVQRLVGITDRRLGERVGDRS